MGTLHFSPRPNRAAEIAWRPWGEEAFVEAKQQGKPVLLAISAVWCHWCHVMDETSYSDPTVIQAINERYIPIRVDNDQRPDVNARYNMGGWPTTALLTAEGEILHGGTYIPPDAMRQLLHQVDGFYADSDNRLAVAKRVSEMRAARASRSRTPQGGDVDSETARKVVAMLSSEFDQEYGGFGSDQKFPHVPALHFLLDYWARTRDVQAQTIVQKTLHAMAGGGMYDHVQGGFFRYSTTPDFSVPHFEKMLEDLGGLLRACARASAMFGDEALGNVAVDTKRYLDEHLWNAQASGYGGSQDADEAYYEQDAAGRAKLPEPYVDKTIYTAWNAEAAHALITSAPLLSNLGGKTNVGGDCKVAPVDSAAWIGRGVQILDVLWDRLLVDGLMCRYYDGAAHVRGLLVDQAWSAWAALAAFSATGDELWLNRTRELLVHVESLYDSESEGYLDRVRSDGDPGRVADQTVPMDENVLLARVLLAFAAFCGESRYAERAQAMLRRYAAHYESYGLFAARYASAILDVVEPPIDVRVVGPAKDGLTLLLRAAALRVAAPPLRVDTVDPAKDRARIELMGYPADCIAAYLCRGKTCFARATTVADFEGALQAKAN